MCVWKPGLVLKKLDRSCEVGSKGAKDERVLFGDLFKMSSYHLELVSSDSSDLLKDFFPWLDKNRPQVGVFRLWSSGASWSRGSPLARPWDPQPMLETKRRTNHQKIRLQTFQMARFRLAGQAKHWYTLVIESGSQVFRLSLVSQPNMQNPWSLLSLRHAEISEQSLSKRLVQLRPENQGSMQGSWSKAFTVESRTKSIQRLPLRTHTCHSFTTEKGIAFSIGKKWLEAYAPC